MTRIGNDDSLSAAARSMNLRVTAYNTWTVSGAWSVIASPGYWYRGSCEHSLYVGRYPASARVLPGSGMASPSALATRSRTVGGTVRRVSSCTR